MSAAAYPVYEARRRSLRNALIASTVGHALVVGLLLLRPALSPRTLQLPSVVTVELVAAAPAPTRAPRPAPAPAPPPPAAKPVPRKVVLPARPAREVEPPPRELVTPRPQPKPAEEDYEDLLEKLREDAGEARPEPIEMVRRRTSPPPSPSPATRPRAQAAPQATPAPTTGAPGRLAPPEVVAWLRDARIHVRRVWVLAPGFRLQPLETHVEVRLDSGGHVVGEPQITRRSGNPWYDESVVRAIEKASPLPAPPEAGEWPFVFRPEE